jgi:hypothetical protein
MAAVLNNKRYGEDAVKNPAILHRMAWLRKGRDAAPRAATHTLERALRERTA